MARHPLPLLPLLAALLLPGPAVAQLPAIADSTQGMERQDGFFPIHWDAAKARLLMEVRLDEEFLYLTSLATGVGSATLGLDRGTIGGEYVAHFARVGPRVQLVLANPQFRAVSDNAALVRSVTESFPTSVAAAFEILAEEDGRLLVDLTPLAVSDVMDAVGSLRRAEQGAFRLDRDRSAVYGPRTKAFPRNTEIEASLTFTSDDPGRLVRSHTPDGRALTLREHHSFVHLPEPGYRPRAFHPQAGFFPTTFWDFAKPFDDDYPTRLISRHRLVKQRPGSAASDPVTPIVYYLDAGIPEPYRSAFREGAMWWARVFEAAGFTNAFRIEDMPPDMDPMDARYHVIQWVHRTAPGYSIGPSLVDPRTGEIIKAAVRMDTYRSQMDYDIYAGTLPVRGEFDDGDATWLASLAQGSDAEAFAMARRRQHTAHEVGHTLGLAHNFATASYGRASVMDYPAPLIQLAGQRLDLRDAYRNGPGAWDTLAIRYGYTEFPVDREAAGLAAILDEARQRGLVFITNPDEGPAGSYPEATTWVNGTDMVAELSRVMAVRRVMLDRFDETAIKPGEPMYLLGTRLTRAYLHHRFTLGATVKAVGGMEFHYAVRGDGLPPTTIIPADRQRAALATVLDALAPEELTVPDRVLRLIPPRPAGFAPEERQFQSGAAPAFDQLAMARSLARDVVDGLLQPQRLGRVVAFAARDPSLPTIGEVMGALLERTWGVEPGGDLQALRRLVQRVVVDGLIDLAADPAAPVEARAAAEWSLTRIEEVAEQQNPLSGDDAAHLSLVLADVARFLDRTDDATRRTRPYATPQGDPIGQGHRRP
jgi:hypothetical protein